MIRYKPITLGGIRDILDHGTEEDHTDLLQALRLYPELVSAIASTVSYQRRTSPDRELNRASTYVHLRAVLAKTLPPQTRAHVKTLDQMWMFPRNEDEHARTGYLYSVRVPGGALPHTAFRTPVALTRWLELRGLQLAGEPTEVGAYRVVGSYRASSHGDYAEFWSHADDAIHTRAWSNGQVTLALITADPDGLRTVHTLSPNCEHRPVFDWRESRAREDAGTVDAYAATSGHEPDSQPANPWAAEASPKMESGHKLVESQ